MIPLLSKKKKLDIFIKNEYKFIYMNDMINLCTEACSICWDKPVPDDLNRRMNYISTRIKTGHESVIEHSNMVILFIIDKKYEEDLIDFLTCCRYINAKTVYDDNRIYLLTGGSIRGYKHIYRNIKSQKNTILSILSRAIYENCPCCFFEDFIVDDIMQRNKFIEFEENVVNGKINEKHLVKSTDPNRIEIINSDANNIDADLLLSLGFDSVDLLDMITYTIVFKNMSRTATHQLVRHRDGITQESQRYVDYSDAEFSSPDMYKDKYDSDIKYHINALKGEYTLQELGKTLISIYKDLRTQEIPLDKEDARGYLPSNVQCGKLYMTFTHKNLMKFLALRRAKGAQAEIRAYANIIFDSIDAVNNNNLESLISYALIPSYKREYNDNESEDLYSKIDEVID